jgi:23S rRNA (adenine2030-N6)-methyltransferase
MATEYRSVVKTLEVALERFPTGTYAVWYPILSKPEAKALPEKLKALAAKSTDSWLNVTLSVRKQPPGTFGMPGSGMFILNPPWTLEKTLRETLPWLVKALAEDGGAGFEIQSKSA